MLGLYRISVYSVFGLDRFIQDFCLFHCIIFFYQIPMPDIPEPELMEKYPQIKKFCYVSSTKGTVSSNIYLISKKGYWYQWTRETIQVMGINEHERLSRLWVSMNMRLSRLWISMKMRDYPGYGYQWTWDYPGYGYQWT